MLKPSGDAQSRDAATPEAQHPLLVQLKEASLYLLTTQRGFHTRSPPESRSSKLRLCLFRFLKHTVEKSQRNPLLRFNWKLYPLYPLTTQRGIPVPAHHPSYGPASWGYAQLKLSDVWVMIEWREALAGVQLLFFSSAQSLSLRSSRFYKQTLRLFSRIWTIPFLV